MPVRTHGGACNWYLYIIKLRHRYYPEIATTKVLPDRQHLWAFLPAEPFECLEQQYVSWRGWWPGRARHKVDRVRILVDQGLPKPTRPSVWPCALLIVIANARRNGNWVLRKSKGRSAEEDGAKGIRGMKTIYARINRWKSWVRRVKTVSPLRLTYVSERRVQSSCAVSLIGGSSIIPS